MERKLSARAENERLEALIEGSSAEEVAYERLISGWLPRLLGVTARFLEQPQHRDAVCRDTLLLAWRNLPGRDRHLSASVWLLGILGSRLYSQLLALHGSPQAVRYRLASMPAGDTATVETPTGPRPVQLSGAWLATLVEQVPPIAPSRTLDVELQELIKAEIEQRHAPKTPSGERVYPPLYDPALRFRMLRSRTGYRLKESFKRRLGRPVEDKLFERWLNGKPGGGLLETHGLPRRSVEAYFNGRLDLDIDPNQLSQGLSFPDSFPNRTQRRKVSNIFIWPGDWDLVTADLSRSQRQRFVQDIWDHRLDLTTSNSYAELTEKLEQGRPLRSHHHGIVLDSEARILIYLSRYRLYMEDMSCFGFKADLGKDKLGIAIDRNGHLVKINKGLHRLAMAQTLGIRRATVRIRSIHQLWWEQHKGNAKGRGALERAIDVVTRT
ncbi:hypothetical protein F0A17_02955 [Billgrantia pellis]|uniref:Uncharacterized protein n=1 Tax=Billgrantia pellis TaxID=2606936 RepID=A0A7V7G4I4_9GAMM|nr:hypothetical protein [Halomonas pellis]KAA0014617.1 hypothetical protein F0A17_02955 [Halomonas pellis]